jgi:putative hydrolase of the HAD superfamily
LAATVPIDTRRGAAAVERLEAITFDFWNTLMWEGPDALVDSRVAALLGIIEETGLPIDETALRSAHQFAFDQYQADWRANRQFCVPDAVSSMAEHLGIEMDQALRASLIHAFDQGGDDAVLHLADGVERCLHRLAASGLKLSIVCDIGLTPSPVVRRHLQRQGLLELFGSWAFSDEVGCYKPDPRIFKSALEGLGCVDPSRVAHVGDRLRTDVAGARALGMRTVRYTGVYDDPEPHSLEADVVLRDYGDLPDHLCLK